MLHVIIDYTLYFFSPCRSLFGVNHFIVFFETNRAIVSRNHPTFACRSSSFSSPLPPSFRPLFRKSSCRGVRLRSWTVFPFLPAASVASLKSLLRRKRRAGMRTFDPWRHKQTYTWQISPQDHGAPHKILSYKIASFYSEIVSAFPNQYS